MRKKLKEYDLGYAYADNEIRSRKDFEKFFYDLNNVSEQIKNYPLKAMVLGRKGTGKTFLSHCTSKQLRADGYISSVESLSSIEFHDLYQHGNNEVSSKKYHSLFKWMLLIKLSCKLIEVRECFCDSKIETLTNFINVFGFKLNQLKPQKIVEETTTYTSDISAGLKGILGVKSKDLESFKFERGSYLELVEALEDFIFSMLSESDAKIIIFYDDLDIRFENSTAYKDGILSYLSAVSDLNYKFIDEDINCKFVTLFRADIFDVLSAPNLNQLIENAIILDWEACDCYDTEIWPMLIHKIRPFLPESLKKEKDHNKIFNAIFDETICGEKARTYVIHRGLGRPRDVIEMLSQVCKAFPEHDKFSSYCFQKIELNYSRYLLKEIKNEMIGHFEQEQINYMFNILSSLKSRMFTKKKFQAYLDKNNSDSFLLNTNDILNGLFKVGAVCHIVKNNTQGGSDQRFHSYLFEDYQLLLNDETQFEIHVGLWPVLQIKVPKNRFG